MDDVDGAKFCLDAGARRFYPNEEGYRRVADNFTTVELFAGAGGLAIGMELAGFSHSAVIEWDENAVATLRCNKARGVDYCREWDIVDRDVRDYDFRQHRGRAMFVAGGPPCQPFSTGGKHGGHADERNMFPQAIRAVREIQPKAFIFENVKGLLRRGFSNYYNYIIQSLRYPTIVPKGDEEWQDHLARLERVYTANAFDGLYYNVIFRVLNAADFGIPQRRERVLIVGIRSDLGIEFSFPQPTHCEDALLHDKWVTGSYWERHGIAKKHRPPIPDRALGRIERLRRECRELMLEPWRTVRDAIADLPKIAIGERCTRFPNHFFNPGARIYAGHDGSGWDAPAKTLKAGAHGVPGGENTLRFAPGKVRYFSVRECARLQTFRDDWIFEGSWTETMRQLGNAVPVDLAAAIAGRLRRQVIEADRRVIPRTS